MNRCPHCNKIDWTYYPRLLKTWRYIHSQGPVTARDLADGLGISIQNACNRIRALSDEKIIVYKDTQNLKTGGLITTWQSCSDPESLR